MTIAHVVSQKAGSTTGNGVTTSAVDTTGADLIVVLIACYQPSAVPAITDSKGNTWTTTTSYSYAGETKIAAAYCLAPTVGSSHTFTATQATSYPSIVVLAFSGVSAYEAISGASTGISGTTFQPGSITPAESGELFIVGGSHKTANAASIDSSFSTVYEYQKTGLAYGNHTSYKIKTDSAAENPTMTYGSAGPAGGILMMCFKAASGGGGSIVGPGLMSSPLLSGRLLRGLVR